MVVSGWFLLWSGDGLVVSGCGLALGLVVVWLCMVVLPRRSGCLVVAWFLCGCVCLVSGLCLVGSGCGLVVLCLCLVVVWL